MGERKLRLISLDSAENLVRGYYARKTIIKKMGSGCLKRYGPYRYPHVDVDEMVKKLKLENIVDVDAFLAKEKTENA